MNTVQQHQLAELLLEIEMEMRRMTLWEREPPPHEALASTMPFCHDLLEFHQWLQWILLPRLATLIEQDMPLPSGSDIHPMAEYCFAELDQDLTRLLTLIGQVDEVLNRE